MPQEPDTPEFSDSMPPPLPETDSPLDDDLLAAEIKPVFFVEAEDDPTAPPPEPVPPEQGMGESGEDTAPTIDPSDFEFEPDPKPAVEEFDAPIESIPTDLPELPEIEEEKSSLEPEDDIIELDLSGFDLEIATPPAETETAPAPESVDGDLDDAAPESDAPLEGEIQMPESFRIEMESEEDTPEPDPDNRTRTPEEILGQVELDETLELELPDDDLGIAPEPSVEDDMPSDTPDQAIEAEAPKEDVEVTPLELEMEAAQETDEPDLAPPDVEMETHRETDEPDLAPLGPESEIPEMDVGYTPEAQASDENGEKVVAPPNFDLFEELPGEDWIEIEVNIEDGGYSTDNLDEYAPELMLEDGSPDASSAEESKIPSDDAVPPGTPNAPVADPPFDDAVTDRDDFPTEVDARAERKTMSRAGQVEPIDHVPTADVQKGLLKRRISLPLPFFAGLLILIAGLAFGLSTLLRPAGPADAGDAAIRLVDIESQFVQNQVVGNVLVITGRAINDYDHPRSFIRVTGKVYTSDQFVQSISVFCGNILTTDELETLSTSDIVQQLRRQAGRDSLNMNIPTGSATPLMIVFPISSDAIDRLDSYTVEVVGSKPS